MFKLIRRPLRPFYRSVALAFVWSNRRDLMRWVSFAKRAVATTTRPSSADLKSEARVRLSVSLDPILRRDAALKDLRVRDGVVTLQSPVGWANRGIAVTRLEQINGIESVHTTSDLGAADARHPVRETSYLSAARAAS